MKLSKLPELGKKGNTLVRWLFAFGLLILSGLVGLICMAISGLLVIFAVLMTQPKES